MGLIALPVFNSPNGLQVIEKATIDLETGRMQGGPIAALLRDPSLGDDLKNEFFKAQMRLALKEAFEVCKTYCKNTQQFQNMRGTSWYHFARIVRDAVTHDFHIDTENKESRLLPLTWRYWTITPEMTGKQVSAGLKGFISHRLVDETMAAYTRFIQTEAL
ncbi:MAG: hypothetical protein HUU29_10095 [Planctomycetaceae bacterium]|nr:hypothetical protein [Planctomycetaceae bacterium]